MLFEELVWGVNIEDRNHEFKRILEEGKSEDSGNPKEVGWLKTLAAFANTDGGTMYVGVDNATHKVVSLSHDVADKMILMVRRQIKEKIEPQIKYDIDFIKVQETSETRYVLAIKVEKSKNLPVFLHYHGLMGIYIRSFGSTIQAHPEDIRDLVLQSEAIPFDRDSTDIPYSKEDFTSLFSVYKEKTGMDLTEKVLASIGFFDEDKKLRRGSLLFSDSYSGERTRMVMTKWPGVDKGDCVILAEEEVKGNIFYTLRKATEFVKSHSTNGFIKEESGRADFYSYPARSVFEGLVNAVAHRNYYMEGTQMEVNIFLDRLEITSPGSLMGYPEIKKEKNISRIIPRRRNELVASVLVYCRYMESKGSGFDKIEDDYSGRGEKWMPYVYSDASSFTLVLPDLSFSKGVVDVDTVPDVVAEGVLGKNEKAVLSYCFPAVRSAKEIASHLGVKPSTYFRRNILTPLVEDGYLLEDKSKTPALYKSNRNKVHIV